MDHRFRVDNILASFLKIKTIRHLFYIILFFAAGIGVWSLAFENTKNKYESIQLSSTAKNLSEIRKAEMASIQRLSFEPASYKKRIKSLPKRFESNPVFKFITYIEQTLKKTDIKDDRKLASEAK